MSNTTIESRGSGVVRRRRDPRRDLQSVRQCADAPWAASSTASIGTTSGWRIWAIASSERVAPLGDGPIVVGLDDHGGDQAGGAEGRSLGSRYPPRWSAV